MEKKTKFYILAIYFIEIIIGSIYVSRFTIPVHSHVDEELYLSMAKSFHYGSGFLQYGDVLNYRAVLYSCIISIAYYLYDPTRILLYIRIINVLIMTSAIFPIYKLADEVLDDKRKVLLTSFILSVVPEMAMTGYIMQEVLYYPLLLWAFYFMYMDMKNDGISYSTILVPFFYMLAFFTKTVGFIFPLLYVVFLAIQSIVDKKLNVKIIINIIICSVLYLIETLFINLVNGGAGTNHYSSQVANLFPITLITIRCFIVGVVVYMACTLISMGVLAVAIPVIKRDEYNNTDKEYLYLSVCFIVASIAEIIILVVYTEHRDFMYPAKYLYRYIFPLFVPVFVLMVKVFEFPANIFSTKIKFKTIGKVGCFSSLVLLVYYIVAGTDIASGIVDSLLFTTITNAVNHVWRYTGGIFAIVLLVISLATIYFSNHTNADNYGLGYKFALSFYILYFVIFDAINFIQLPYYNNVICGGDISQKQFIQIAEWLNSNEHDKLIYVCSGFDPKNSLWGYIKEDYKIMTYEEYMLSQYEDSISDGTALVIDKEAVNNYTLETSEEVYSTDDYLIISGKNGL